MEGVAVSTEREREYSVCAAESLGKSNAIPCIFYQMFAPGIASMHVHESAGETARDGAGERSRRELRRERSKKGEEREEVREKQGKERAWIATVGSDCARV